MTLARKFALAAALFAAAASVAPAQARPQVWFGADDAWVREWKHRPANDYMDLFTGDGAWAKGVEVIQLSMQFVVWGKEDQLKTVIDFAQRHHIKIAMVGLMLAMHDNCGQHLEGYSSPHGVEKAATRFKALGGTLTYIVMDEPVYYGSVYPLEHACNTPLPELASEIAERVKQVRAVFPSVVIGEDEVVGLADKFAWVPTLGRWLEAYRQAVGEPLGFLHMDIGWPSPRWPAQLAAIDALTHRSGVKFGVYYTGNPKDADDATWTGNSEERERQIEKDMGLHVDQALIMSWMPHPDAMLPPSDPNTLTGDLHCYLAMHGEGPAPAGCR